MYINHEEYRILICDDSNSSLEKMKALLISEGFDVVLCPNRKEMMESAIANSPDLIILRSITVCLHAFNVVRELKKNHLVSEIPIIYLTSSLGANRVNEVLDLDGVEVVYRPLSKNELVLRINNHLRLIDSNRMITGLTNRIEKIAKVRDKIMDIILNNLKEPVMNLNRMLEVLPEQYTAKSEESVRIYLDMLADSVNEVKTVIEKLEAENSQQAL